jgi:DNA-binding MarR family transcriptional regulator/GNAT superfamily N-acetyltransferase
MLVADELATVRAFNRFWTRQIGVLQAGLLDTPWSLTEARVLFEVAQAESPARPPAATPHGVGLTTDPRSLADLRAELGLDAGYLTRIVARLKDAGLVTTERSPDDGRRQVIRLTEAGRAEFRRLDERANADAAAMLAGVPADDRRRLVSAMTTIQATLAPPDGEPPRAYQLRDPGPGELGWIVQRHGELYAAEYGWDQTFEALVARIVADYGEHRDSARERAWIAEVHGEPAGCVLCTRHDDETAQLRVLLVEPAARGLGIGARLVEECIRFARPAGYREITLWTHSVLTAARRIYEQTGFRLVSSADHDEFGKRLTGETWELRL